LWQAILSENFEFKYTNLKDKILLNILYRNRIDLLLRKVFHSILSFYKTNFIFESRLAIDKHAALLSCFFTVVRTVNEPLNLSASIYYGKPCDDFDTCGGRSCIHAFK